MKQLLFVFLGGGVGSIFRYLISKLFNSSSAYGIAWGTFMVNVLGALLIGFILGLASKNETLSQNHTLLLATGFCGGLTTFSTFAYENHLLLKSGDFVFFLLYTVLTLVLGIIAVFAGMHLVKLL